MAKKTQNTRKPTAIEIANKIVEDCRVDVAGMQNYGATGLLDHMNNNLIDQLRDAVSTDWWKAENRADELSAILVKTKGFGEYANCRTRELCIEQDVWFSLGFATALRLLGRREV